MNRQTCIRHIFTTLCTFLKCTITALLFLPAGPATAQLDSQDNPASTVQINALAELASLIEAKTQLREQLKLQISGSENVSIEDNLALNEVRRELDVLNESFLLNALGKSSSIIVKPPEATDTTWQQEVVDILKPLIDSLKSVTRKPRQIAQLRDRIDQLDLSSSEYEDAVLTINGLLSQNISVAARNKLSRYLDDWIDQTQQLKQEKLLAQSQLSELTAEDESLWQSAHRTARTFFLGRGLTLFIALIAAIGTWLTLRALWWLYATQLTSKETRRKSTWFRVVSYSYYVVATLAIMCAVLMVLYLREDVLMLAIAFLLITAALFSLRQFLPRYVSEARLLLNLGSVREGERVVYNGLPWQVNSLNLHSVLWNPALDGVVRLPLHTMSELVSRPVKNKLWFPTSPGDVILLPDETMGTVKHQTPDLVEINVRGGMTMTYPTADFYALQVMNLSRDPTFGVWIVFGLDYNLQDKSLKEIPQTLKAFVVAELEAAGYQQQMESAMAELSEAGASSIDFIVYVSLKSEVAADYFKIRRLLTQACVAAANEHQWQIPFPQLTIHQASTQQS